MSMPKAAEALEASVQKVERFIAGTRVFKAMTKEEKQRVADDISAAIVDVDSVFGEE